MPAHFHPVLRFREESRESSGSLARQPLDTVGVTILKAQETAGRTKKIPHASMKFYFRGTQYTAT